MKVFLACLVLVLAVTVTSARSSKTKVELAFAKHGLTKYIKVPPKVYVTAEYSGHFFVDLGNELTPAQVPQAPHKRFPADKKEYFIIIFIHVNNSSDPDIQHLCGMTVNIPGGIVEKGQIISNYNPPQPAEGTGYHYYITLAFKQPRMFDADEINEVKSYFGLQHPESFCLREFTERYCLGNAYAGNFFKAKYQERQEPADADSH